MACSPGEGLRLGEKRGWTFRDARLSAHRSHPADMPLEAPFMGRHPLAPRIHRGAGLLTRLSDHVNGWKVALESVSVEQDSIKALLTDNLCVHPSLYTLDPDLPRCYNRSATDLWAVSARTQLVDN